LTGAFGTPFLSFAQQRKDLAAPISIRVCARRANSIERTGSWAKSYYFIGLAESNDRLRLFEDPHTSYEDNTATA